METTTFPFPAGTKVVYTNASGISYNATVLGRGDRGMIEISIYGSGSGCVTAESLVAR